MTAMGELDPDIHQPTRLRIVTLLSGVGRADFSFVRNALGLTEGNLSSHMNRLEQVGYVEVSKGFDGKIPKTSYRLTRRGRSSLEKYWQAIDGLRGGTWQAQG
jgi:predicted ArsR family transcriptional regulator